MSAVSFSRRLSILHPITNGITQPTMTGKVFTQFHKLYSSATAERGMANKHPVKPLVIVLPWLGASKRTLSKYCQLYKDFGCNVLVKQPHAFDFLWPAKGLKSCRKFLSELKINMGSDNCPIIIHSSSIGCYFYALMLMHFKNDPKAFDKIAKNIKCQVLDSPVAGTLREMATGVALASTSSKTANVVLKRLIMSYFALTGRFTVKIYNQSIDAMKFNPPNIPSLILSSSCDPMALPAALDDLIKIWKSNGLDVRSKIWPDSPHTHHLRCHPELYKELVYKLLQDSLGSDVRLLSKL